IDGTFLVGIALALVVGDLLARHIRQGAPRPTLAGALAVTAGLAALVGSALAVSAITGHVRASAIELLKTVPFVLAVLALLWVHRTRDLRATAAIVLVAIAAGELLVWNTA